MAKLTTGRLCLQSVSQNGYTSGIAATQPFAVPNTDLQRLLPMIMIKDLLTLRLALYITDCADKPTHLPAQPQSAHGGKGKSICAGDN